MKKLITLLLILVAFLGVAVLSYSVAQHYNNYQESQQATVLEADTESQDKIKALEAENTALANKNVYLVAECEKGVVAYSNLTAFYRNNLDAPVCEQPVTE